MYKPYLILALVLYVISYSFYLLISHGLGSKATYLQMRRYIPCALAAVVPIALVDIGIQVPFFLGTLFIAFMWIFTYPTLFYISNHKVSPDFEFHFEAVFGYYLVAWLSSLLILAHYLPAWANIPVAAVVTIVEVLMFLIPVSLIIYYLLYKECISETGMQMLQDTNYNEIIEFFKQMPVVLNLVSILAVGGSCYGFFKINYAFLQSSIELNIYQACILGALAIFLTDYLWKKKKGVFVRTGIGEFYLDVKEYRDTNKNYKANTKSRMDTLQVKALGQPFDKPSTIVMVIGESASRDYMHAFNESYPLPTTPWLDKLKTDKNCILVPHAYSSLPMTVASLSRALTEFNQYNDKKFFESCSVVDIAHKLGYKVHWYSNQGHLGCADTPISLLAETSDVAKWTKQKLNEVQFDESLLKYLDLNCNSKLHTFFNPLGCIYAV